MPEQYRLILKNIDAPGYSNDLECYLRHGGYEALKKALALAPKDLPDGKKESAQEQLRDEGKASGLRGRGGAGFFCGVERVLRGGQKGQTDLLDFNTGRKGAGALQESQD